jgi:RNA recognition motif-containing protein
LKDEFAAQQQSEEGTNKPFTTLMIRNIPNRYSQRELIMELEDLGFAGAFDFLYVPLDKGTMLNVGYAFVNFVEPSWAEQCIRVFRNYRFKRHRKLSSKIASVSVAHIQGLEANLAHYEKAAVSASKLKQQRPVLMANISHALTGVGSDGEA